MAHDTEAPSANYYIGKRLVGVKLLHCFKKADAADSTGFWYFTKAKGAAMWGLTIGECYTFDTIPRLWSEARDTDVQRHEQADVWQAEHRLAIERNKVRNKTVDPQVCEHVEALRAACRNMTANDRAKFLTYLIQTFMAWR